MPVAFFPTPIAPMIPNLNPTMGMVIARAWSDPQFMGRLISDPKAGLGELSITVAAHVRVVAGESTNDVIYLVLSAPPLAVPISALSQIRDFAEIYRDPRLWSLNWRGRDPVATARIVANPIGELAKLGVSCPDDLDVRILINTPDTAHLVIPPRPPDRYCTAGVLEHISLGYIPPTLRFGRLLESAAYGSLMAALLRTSSQSLHA